MFILDSHHKPTSITRTTTPSDVYAKYLVWQVLAKKATLATWFPDSFLNVLLLFFVMLTLAHIRAGRDERVKDDQNIYMYIVHTYKHISSNIRYFQVLGKHENHRYYEILSFSSWLSKFLYLDISISFCK
jgi:hypothetical protein